jgi:hypothetical protein
MDFFFYGGWFSFHGLLWGSLHNFFREGAYLSCVSEIRVELATEYFHHNLYLAIVIFISFEPFNPSKYETGYV